MTSRIVRMNINYQSVHKTCKTTMLGKALAIATVIAAMATMATITSLQEVYAPSGRRWVPAVGDTLTYQDGVFNSKLEPNYPIDYASCLVTENTATEGQISMTCEIYAPEYKQ